VRFINAVSNALSWIERSLLVLMLAVITLLAFLQVILRNVFSEGILWADPLLRHMVLWMGFLGASLATQKEKHITIDLMTRFFRPPLTHLIRIATNLFASGVCWFLSQAGWTFLQNERDSGDILFTIGSYNFPAWWFQIIIPIGFGLMTFRFLIAAIEHSVKAVRPTVEKERTSNSPPWGV
jgi:TRAP-type C4-dicarboxylate transport system permease small subunit